MKNLTELLLLMVMIFSCSQASDEKNLKVEDLGIFYSSYTAGGLEPCGCKIPLGGLSRRETALNEYRYENDNLILVDGGDALLNNRNNEKTEKSEKLKGKYIYKIYKAMGYDVYTAGRSEFSYGKEYLKSIGDELSIEFLFSNKIDPSIREELNLTEYKIIERSGVKIGFLNFLLDDFYRDKNLQYLETEVTEELIKEKVDMLKKKADVIAVVFSSNSHYAKKYIQSLKEETIKDIDIYLFGHTYYAMQKYFTIDNKPVLTTGREGKYCAYLGFQYRSIEDSIFINPETDYQVIRLTEDYADSPKIEKLIDEYLKEFDEVHNIRRVRRDED